MADTPEEKSYTLFKAANGLDFLMSPATRSLMQDDAKLAHRLEETAETIARVETKMQTRFDRPVFLLDSDDWHFGTVIGPTNDVKSYLKLNQQDGDSLLGNDTAALKSVLQLPLFALKDDSPHAHTHLETAIAHELGHAVNKRISDSLTELEILSEEIATTTSGDWFNKANGKLQALFDAAPRATNGEITPESLLEGFRQNGAFMDALHGCNDLNESPLMKMMFSFMGESENTKIEGESRAQLLDSVHSLIKNLNHALEYSSDDFALRHNPEGTKQANDKLMEAANPSYDNFSHPASDTRVVRIGLLDETRQKLQAENGTIDEDAALKHTNHAMGNVRDATEKMTAWRDKYEAEKAAQAAKPHKPSR